eukprot:403365656
MGGTQQDTIFLTFDIDSTNNIVAGGASKDSGLLYDSSNTRAFIINILYGNYYNWAVQFSVPTSTSYETRVVKFFPTYDKLVVAVTSTGGWSAQRSYILIVNAVDGTVISSYKEGDNNYQFRQDAIAINAAGTSVYIGGSAPPWNRWIIFKFAPTAPTVTANAVTYGNLAGNVNSIKLDPTETNVYAIGHFKEDWSSKAYPTITSIDATTLGTVNYHFSMLDDYDSDDNDYYKFERSHIVQDSGFQYLWVCGNNNGGDKNLVVLIKLNGVTLPTTQKQGKMDKSDGHECRTIYGVNSTTAYIIYYESKDEDTVLAQVDYTSNNRINYYALPMMYGSDNNIQHAIFISQTRAYFAGGVKKIKANSPYSDFQWSKQVGFIGSTDPAQLTGCMTLNIAYTRKNLKTESLVLASRTFGGQSITTKSFANGGITSQEMKTTSVVDPNAYCSPQPLKTIVKPDLPNVKYPVGSGPLSFQLGEFTITDTSCSDAQFVYKASLTNGSNTADTSKVGIYNITVYATLTNSQKSSQNFLLEVTLSCLNAQLSVTTPLVTQTYTIGDPSHTYNIPEFTSDTSYCQVGYTVTNDDLTPLDSSIFTYQRATRNFIIQSNDLTKTLVAPYDITVEAYIINGNLLNNLTATFQVQVLDPCLTATLTVTEIFEVTYYIGSPKMVFDIEAHTSALNNVCGAWNEGNLLTPINPMYYTVVGSGRQQQLELYSENLSLNNTASIIIVQVSQGTYTSDIGTMTFQINFDFLCNLTGIQVPANQTKYIDISSTTNTLIYIDSFNATPHCTGYLFQYDCKMANGLVPCTNPLTFDNVTRFITVYPTSNMSFLGEHQLIISGDYQGEQTKEAYVKIVFYISCSSITITGTPIGPLEWDLSENRTKIFDVVYFTHNGNSSCNSFTYSLKDVRTGINPTFMQMFGSQLQMDSPSDLDVGYQHLQIILSSSTGTVLGTFDFYLNITNLCSTSVVTTPTIPPQVYFVDSPPLQIYIPEFIVDLAFCLPNITVLTSDPLDSQMIQVRISATHLRNTIIYSTSFFVNVTAACSYLEIEMAPIPDYYYQIGSGAKIIQIDQWNLSNPACGSITYSAFYDNFQPISGLSPTATFSPVLRTLTVNTADTLLNSYSKVIIINAQSGTIVARKQFTLYFSNRCKLIKLSPNPLDTDDNTMIQHNYTVTSSVLSIYFNPFIEELGCITSAVTYTVTLADDGTVPAYLSYSNSPNMYLIRIQTNDTTFVRTEPYLLKILATHLNYDTTTTTSELYVPLKISSPNLEPPYFKTNLTDVTMKAGETLTYSFPELLDIDNDGIKTIKVNLGQSQSFISGNHPQLLMRPKLNDVGTYTISVFVQDDNLQPKQATYIFNVVVTDPAKNETSKNNQTNQNQTTQPPSPIEELYANKAIKTNLSKSLKASISKISNSGLMTVKFSSNILVPKSYQMFNESVLIISFKDEETQKLINIKWRISSFTSSQIQFQLEFSDPKEVSLYTSDKMVPRQLRKDSNIHQFILTYILGASLMLSESGGAAEGAISTLILDLRLNSKVQSQ